MTGGGLKDKAVPEPVDEIKLELFHSRVFRRPYDALQLDERNCAAPVANGRRRSNPVEKFMRSLPVKQSKQMAPDSAESQQGRG
jgi:hypothetical protein